MTRTAMVIVASTRAASGVYEDTSGKLLTEWLRIRGFSAPDPVIVADAEMPEFLPSCWRISISYLRCCSVPAVLVLLKMI